MKEGRSVFIALVFALLLVLSVSVVSAFWPFTVTGKVIDDYSTSAQIIVPDVRTYDGSGAYGTTSASNIKTSKKAVTVGGWFNTKALRTGNNEITGSWVSKRNSYILSAETDGSVKFWVFLDDAWYSVSSGANRLPLNTWDHWVGTWDGATISLYRGGVLEASVAASGTLGTTGDLCIGHDCGLPAPYDNRYFEGRAYDVRVYADALSEQAVKDLYREGKKKLAGMTTTPNQGGGSGTAQCTDDDTKDTDERDGFPNGKNYFVKGTLVNKDGGKATDYCSVSDEGAVVFEYFCTSADTAALEKYPCLNGCVDGACVASGGSGTASCDVTRITIEDGIIDLRIMGTSFSVYAQPFGESAAIYFSKVGNDKKEYTASLRAYESFKIPETNIKVIVEGIENSPLGLGWGRVSLVFLPESCDAPAIQKLSQTACKERALSIKDVKSESESNLYTSINYKSTNLQLLQMRTFISSKTEGKVEKRKCLILGISCTGSSSLQDNTCTLRTVNCNPSDGDIIIEDSACASEGVSVAYSTSEGSSAIEFEKLNKLANSLKETTTITNDGSYVLQLKTTIKSGEVTMPLLYTNASGSFLGIGKSPSNRLVTSSMTSRVLYNYTGGDRYMVVTLNDSRNPVSYLVRFNSYTAEEFANKTNVEYYSNGAWTSKGDKKAGDIVNFDNLVSLKIDEVYINSGTKSVYVSAQDNRIKFNMLATREGLAIYLPTLDESLRYSLYGSTTEQGAIGNSLSRFYFSEYFHLVVHGQDVSGNFEAGKEAIITLSQQRSGSSSYVDVNKIYTRQSSYSDPANTDNIISSTGGDVPIVALHKGSISAPRTAFIYYSGTSSSGGTSGSGGSSGGGGSGGGSGSSNSCATIGCNLPSSDGSSKCIGFGTRAGGDYCALSGTMKAQRAAEATCENNYECGSNVCAGGKCVDAGLFEKIINFFRKLFGGGGTGGQMFLSQVRQL